MIELFKKYWHNYREHKLLMLAISVGLVVLYYTLIWMPLHTSVIQLRREISHEQKVLDWLISHKNQ